MKKLHLTQFSLQGDQRDELKQCSATLEDVTKASCVYTHVLFSPSCLLSCTQSHTPRNTNFEKEIKQFVIYKRILCITTVGQFSQMWLRTKIYSALEDMHRERVEGTYRLCQGG